MFTGGGVRFHTAVLYELVQAYRLNFCPPMNATCNNYSNVLYIVSY